MIQVYSILSLGKVLSMFFEFILQGFLLLLDCEVAEKKDKQKEAKRVFSYWNNVSKKRSLFRKNMTHPSA